MFAFCVVGCDIIIQTDTSISRNHADIVIDKMTSFSFDTSPSRVRIVDKSKYGTFIRSESGSKVVRLVKDKDAELHEGDLVTFGTSNATFRRVFFLFIWGFKFMCYELLSVL